MKILNNIGAISKQALVGGAIGVATLVVGIGLMNNFSKSGSSQQGFASNALERSSGYSAAYTGASAEDILSARDYAQNGREGTLSAISGTENLAINRRNTAPSSAQATDQEQGEGQALEGVQDGSQAYGDGEIEGMGTSNKISVDIAAADEAADQAQRNAKIAKGQALGETARATLKTSKMADASGIKGMPTGSTSMTYGTLGNNSATSAGAKDSSKISLAQAGKLSNVDLQAAQAGKIGAMGNNSKEADGKRIGRASIGQNYQALGDLGRASKYSRSGKEAVNTDAAQGAADAAAAFDGSKEAEVASLEGENLQKAAVNSLEDMGAPDMRNDLKQIQADIEQIDANMEKWSRLMDQYKMCIWSMMLIASVAALALAILSKAQEVPFIMIGMFVIFGIAVLGMIAAAIASNVILGQIADLAKETGYTQAPKGIDWAVPWLVTLGLSGVLLLAMEGIAQGLLGKANMLSTIIGLLSTGGLSGLTYSLQKMFSLGKEIKASKEAEKVAEEINNQANNTNNNSNGSNGGNGGDILNSGKGRR